MMWTMKTPRDDDVLPVIGRSERERNIERTRLYSWVRDTIIDAMERGLPEEDVRLAVWAALTHDAR